VASEVQQDKPLERLPLPYATALRLRNAGIADEVIADCVGVELDALPTFMQVAYAKLRTASRETTSGKLPGG
jgi:hypothetical protein